MVKMNVTAFDIAEIVEGFHQNAHQLISVEMGFCISDVEVPTLDIAKLLHA